MCEFNLKGIDVKCSKVSAYTIKRHLFSLSPKEKNPYPFPLVNVQNKPKGRLSLMYKAPRAFKRFGIPIGLGPADRPQKPTRHHIHMDTGWGPDIQILLFGRLPVLFYIFLSSMSSLSCTHVSPSDPWQRLGSNCYWPWGVIYSESCNP